MLVMGGIVGAGIFMNPYVVAQQVHAARADSWSMDFQVASSQWVAHSSELGWT